MAKFKVGDKVYVVIGESWKNEENEDEEWSYGRFAYRGVIFSITPAHWKEKGLFRKKQVFVKRLYYVRVVEKGKRKDQVVGISEKNVASDLRKRGNK